MNPIAKFEFTIKVFQEDEQWIAHCEELGVASSGESIEVALDNVQDAIVLYLDTASEEKQLERILREKRIKPEVRPVRPEPGVLVTSFRPPVRDLVPA